MADDTIFSCPRCFIGHCRPSKVVYVQMVGGRMFNVPDMPAHVCDICGYREYDEDALHQIQKMLGEEELPNSDAPTPPSASHDADADNVRRPKA